MASEDQLLAAAAAAKPFATAGEEVVGVLVADPFDHGLVFLCALGPPAEDDDGDPDEVPELGWIAVDGDGLALGDDRRVQEAAMLAALCETAEEAALVPDAAEIAESAERALALAGGERPELTAALEATREGALAAAAFGDGLRVARTGYVDQLADAARAIAAATQELQQCAGQLSSGLSGLPLDPSEPLARAVWDVLERLAAAGAPERFSDELTDASGAISAFAEDVLEHYRAELDDDEEHEHGHDHGDPA
ncbi:MAG TPA: hypothetical protein VGK92_02275 [Gaiellales bacterium]